MEKLGIIKLSYSNIKSLCFILDNLNIDYDILNEATEVKKYKKIVLPGTSSFKTAMEDLKIRSFDKAIIDHVKSDGYLLGICIGMQLLFSYGSEGGIINGLDLIKGKVVPINGNCSDGEIFHIGWNDIIIQNNIELLNDITEEENFYFIHSFHCHLDEDIKFCKTKFDKYDIISVVNKDNIFGIQFHPEKSHIPGKKILKNFSDIIC